ncbi:outer-membrane lipoprotein carrier protein LolA [Aureimonas leprariae]|uniref:Outer membrane lipoprotein carrier protein LolA n=1 Tax=Plantimonas leprariae TaxID=2615207 RepID=A0A7V7PRM0_9HYPH|nr:outer-membrane lipoprotein carrier protein LolA [Aureimonas leprariae]KAB0681454.1 outer membrane lipoprotein carrier protein LolA [Aureimonas leprariae]
MTPSTTLGRLAAAALAAGVLLGSASLPGRAAAQATDTAAAQAVADHFSSIRSMSGDFVQFDDKGRQTEGKFFIERPGKIRFDYAGTPVRVIADGANVAVNNRKLNTWDLYPLSKTPMKLLLDNRIDLSSANIQDVKQEADLTTIVMGDKSIFGSSRITMMFDPKTYDLRQWTIRDGQGRDTTVMIANVKTGASAQDSMFKIPYTAISQGQTGNRK